MDDMKGMARISSAGRQGRLESLRGNRRFFVGIDIGSISSDVVVIDQSGEIVFQDYRRTMGRPIDTARAQLDKLLGRISAPQIELVAATGSAGRLLSKILGIPFVNEVPAQAAAICHLYPDFAEATVIEMGGQDNKLIFLADRHSSSRVQDFVLNTVCAAGTGSFLDQQAQRLGIDIEDEFGRMAVESKSVPRMAGRCSVFAKSDMIHLQQQATPTCDIIAGLCVALARNLKSNLGCGREFVKPIVFTGGVAANIGVVRALEQVLELTEGELVVPGEHFFTGAIGAVLVAKSRTEAIGQGGIELAKINNYLTQRGLAVASMPRREVLSGPSLQRPKSFVREDLLAETAEPIDAYLGVDVGSISTNVVVIDDHKRVLAKAYLMTAGRPLEAVRKGLDIVGGKVMGKVKILAAASTGSGRYLTGDFIGADVVINEITAQAAGAAIVNPDVDTIFEIGGQDSKYISLKNGVVVDFEMNHACAAGTGSFLEEQAQRLDISINEEFAQLALGSKAPIKLGERCTVFMESDLLNYQQQGAKTEDLVAGLSYSIVTNYLNRVVGRRKIGDKICFQGGTAFNKAVWAAFEKVTGKQIIVPDHHEVTGALGAAAIGAEHMKQVAEAGEIAESSFRGFENLVSVEYEVESFTCEHCANNCEIKKLQSPLMERPLYYGSRCDRYNLKKESHKGGGFGAFEYRHRMLFACAELDGEQTNTEGAKTTVGIPMSLVNWQLLPLFSRFFKSLGFEVVVSGKSDKRVIRRGVELVTAQPCFPVKVAYGHVAELIDKGVDYIFLPSIVSTIRNFAGSEHSQLCPYVQSFAYQVQAAFAGRLGSSKILTAPIRMGEGSRLCKKSFYSLGKKLAVSRSAVRSALEAGLGAQERFEKSLRAKGAEILSKVAPGEKLFVLVSRPYNGCDDGLNLELPKKLGALGVDVVPMDMLDLAAAPLGDEQLHRETYWTYGQKILRAAEIVKRDNRLFAVYLSNFSCGPDSFLLTFFKDIVNPKPCLQLELDEHSADAGVITRLEAFLESLKNYDSHQEKTAVGVKTSPRKVSLDERTLYLPYMGDCSYAMAASFRAYGRPARVIDLADEAALLKGRAYTTGKECLPCAITTGDMLKVIGSDDFDPDKSAFFMPSSRGPCRFGMYNCMHRLVLGYAGAGDIPVISPNQDGGFYSELTESVDGSSRGGFMQHTWSGVVGVDLLHKVILRIRPFASVPAEAQRVYEKALARWTGAVESRWELSRLRWLMGILAENLAGVELDFGILKPRIGIVGEIYVRNHPFANKNIVERLENLGAACDLASLAEWVYYTNNTRGCKAGRLGQLRNLLSNSIQDYVQHKIEKSLAEPLEKHFGVLAEEPTGHVLALAKPYIHQTFEGEAVLSVGKMVEYHHKGVGGVVNVMPFGCMPSTIVSTVTRRVSSDCGEMPILNLSFDGQEDPTLTTRLEAFVECAKAYRRPVGAMSPVS